MHRAGSCLGILFLGVLSACAGTEGPAGNPATSPQDEAATYDWLVGEEVPTDSVLRVRVSQDRLDAEIDGDPLFKVGAGEEIWERVEFSAVSADGLSRADQRASFGAIRGLAADGFVWSGVVETPGSTAIRLELTDVYLPRGVELWAYGDQGQAFGPYTGEGPRGTGEFSVNTLRGEHARLQLRYEGGNSAKALAATHFTIEEVGHLDERFFLGQPPTARSHCTQGDFTGDWANADCVENAECFGPALSGADRAVAHMLFPSGGFYYLCTGGLIADTANSGTALFLTAHHCISRTKEAAGLETYWDYSVPCGTSECYFPTSTTTVGAQILATGSTGDYSLLLLDELPDANRAFLPFDAMPVANTNQAELHRYHHPLGAPLSYSSHDVSTSAGTCSSLPRGSFIYSRDTIGATQGGSSGSPVLNASGKVVGQLYGACGTNLNDECDPAHNATVDGALAAYYTAVKPYLDPGTSCSPEVCTDGIDNDCDGAVDGADPDCVAPGCINPGGDPAGAFCDLNADCCSNRCKGKPGAKTCR